MASKEIIGKVKKYIEILNPSGLIIDKTFLYGSTARNEEGRDSDIDVMLVSRDFDDKSDDQTIGLIWRLTRRVDSRIEPFAVGLKRFNQDKISPLLQLVKKEGIPIIWSFL